MNQIEYQSGAISAGDCISNAWTIVTNKFWLYIGLGVLTLVLLGCLPLINLFIMGPVLGGFYYVVLRDMRGEPVEFGMLFKGFEKFVPLMVVGLITSVPSIIFQILRFTVDISNIVGTRGSGTSSSPLTPDIRALIAGVSAMVVLTIIGFALFSAIWQIALSFAIPIALDHQVGPLEAIKLSIAAALSNIGGLIVLIILEFLVSMLGVLALCLGYFVALPVVYAANAFAYRQVFPLIEQRFNYAPPPPTEYGNFGV